jgi:hypothetical protein
MLKQVIVGYIKSNPPLLFRAIGKIFFKLTMEYSDYLRFTERQIM